MTHKTSRDTTPITISVYETDQNANREIRLATLLKRLRLDTRKIIGALHDHKGCVYVNWTTCPTTSQVGEVIAGWAKLCECLSNHYVRGRPLLEDLGDDSPPFEPAEPRTAEQWLKQHSVRNICSVKDEVK